MVLRGETPTPTTTARTERPKSLHNFTLPNLKWGSQRHLKCSKIECLSSGSGGSSGDLRLRRRSPPLKLPSSSSVSIPAEHWRRNNQHRRAPFESVEDGGEEEEEEGIEEFRVKIMSDLKTVRDKITQSMFRKDPLEEEEQREEERKTDESGHEKVSPVKPWNLRKRRAACKEPVAIEERIVNPSPLRVEAERAKEMMMRRPKFSVKLSKKEIEEDFMAALGHRPPRRPKKRPRTVQKKLDSLHPGFYLTEVTLDAYKVPEETKRC